VTRTGTCLWEGKGSWRRYAVGKCYSAAVKCFKVRKKILNGFPKRTLPKIKNLRNKAKTHFNAMLDFLPVVTFAAYANLESSPDKLQWNLLPEGDYTNFTSGCNKSMFTAKSSFDDILAWSSSCFLSWVSTYNISVQLAHMGSDSITDLRVCHSGTNCRSYHLATPRPICRPVYGTQ